MGLLGVWIRTLALALGVAAIAVAQVAGAQQADGGASCTASSECATPRPHCHPTLRTCVACLGDRNCPAGGVCQVDEGVCAECRSDSHCSALRPYCVTGGRCVECLTTANCGDSGITCQDGKCGSCGDAICGPREVLDYSFGRDPAADGITVCREDCLSLCPTVDLGSALGTFPIGTAGLRNVTNLACTPTDNSAGVDAFVKWTAPHTGVFNLGARNANVGQYEGGCSGYTTACSSGGGFIGVSIAAGQEVVFHLEAAQGETPATFEFEIQVGATPGCDSGMCPPPDAGDKGSAEQCLASAEDRDDPMCSGVECACNHCPRDYDDCQVIPGCRRILDCMQAKGCVGVDCYNSGVCRSAIDSFGGISGPAFRAGSGLQSCSLSFQCGLPCGGSAPDAGSPDAGQLCTPDASVVCACGDRSGTKRCQADGMAFDTCNCAAASPAAEDDGCGCRLAGASGASSLAAGFGVSLVFVLLRRRRRTNRRAVQ